MATLFPLPEPEPQFCDANGVPYAGGTIATYIPGTDTFQNTWSNMEGTALNTNPIVLDAAGRALIYGSGNYRFVLKDAAGNLIYDQETSAVDPSAFATMAEVNAAVQAETDRAEAAEAAETARAEAAENTLTTNLNAEIARAEAAEAALSSRISALEHPTGGTTAVQIVQFGITAADSSGFASVTFTTSYTNVPSVVANVWGSSFSDEWINIMPSTTGFTAYCSQPLAGDVLAAAPGLGFMWVAVGT